MKTPKFITTANRFFRSIILKKNKIVVNKVKFTNFKKTSNVALTQMYTQDNETLFI